MRDCPRTPFLAPTTPFSTLPVVFCSPMRRCPELTRGVRRLFGRELVDTGEIEPEWAKILARLQDRREDADYDASARIEEDQARELVDQSIRFIERMGEYLTSKGVPPSRGAE
jgi:hypothetical protein